MICKGQQVSLVACSQIEGFCRRNEGKKIIPGGVTYAKKFTKVYTI